MRPMAWLGLRWRGLTRMLAALALSAAVLGSAPTFAETLYCSTRQGIRTCSSPDGYRSTERSRDGMRFGQDSDGYRWTTSRCETPPSPRSSRPRSADGPALGASRENMPSGHKLTERRFRNQMGDDQQRPQRPYEPRGRLSRPSGHHPRGHLRQSRS
jgi:hypothetical protein